MGYITLWEVPDGLWEWIERVLPREKPKGSIGRLALSNRQVVNGILFVLRSGCYWLALIYFTQAQYSFDTSNNQRRLF